ncbi:hypothetical protein [Schaalia canis]|uniref:Uncharacterized protein n=1 Tax=Schaalia canis TaxID=100469 RepID=A0A3P1SE48_9ACTO|nr:hypothetical protein [Schaalia canis]RRC95289.1 hypothetical protein EII11_06545 [Schaalia canis]
MNQQQTPPIIPPSTKPTPQKRHRFGWTYDHEITRPKPQHLLAATAAVSIAALWPTIVPNVEPFFIALQAFIASGVFLAGAHRTSRIRITMPIVITAVITGVIGRIAPQAIPTGFLLVYAFFTFGNAWKYWYLQQDPNRHNPHYRYFKDPNTKPQRHVIYGLAIIIGLTVPPPLLVYVLMTDLFYLPEKVAAWTASILALGILLWGLARIILGIVQLIRRALHRHSASTHPEHT